MTSKRSRHGPFVPFRHQAYREIWIANLLSNFGGIIQSVGAAWTMTLITHSPTLVSLVQASTTLPIMLLALLAGALADNFNHRMVMLGSQVLMLIASTALAILAYTGHITPALLLLFTLLVGVGQALNTPSWQASIRDMVPMKEVSAAVALNSIGFNLARSFGPAIGGTLIAVYGATANFAVNAVSYVFLLIALLRWRSTQVLPARAPIWGLMKQGPVEVYRIRELRHTLWRAGLFGVCSASLWALMPLIARDLLHGDQYMFGLLLGLVGTGSVMGALFAVRGRQLWGNDAIFSLASLIFGVALLLTVLLPNVAWCAPLMVAIGASWIMSMSTVNIVVQFTAPPHLVGRSLALYYMHAFGGLSVGSYLFGQLAEVTSVTTALSTSAAILIASPLLNRVWRLPETRPSRVTMATDA